MPSKLGLRPHRRSRSDAPRASPFPVPRQALSRDMPTFLAQVVWRLLGTVTCFLPTDNRSFLAMFFYLGITILGAWLVDVDVFSVGAEALTCDPTETSFLRMQSCGWTYNLGLLGFWLLSRNCKLKQRLLAEMAQYLMFFLLFDVLELCGTCVCASRIVRMLSQPIDTTFIWLFTKYFHGDDSVNYASLVAAVHLATQSPLRHQLEALLPGLWWWCFVCLIHAPVVWGTLANLRDSRGLLAFLGLEEPVQPEDKHREEGERGEGAREEVQAAAATEQEQTDQRCPKKDRLKENKGAEKAKEQELTKAREKAREEERAARKRAKKEEERVRKEEQLRANEEERKRRLAVEEEEILHRLREEGERARREEEDRVRKEAEREKERDRAKKRQQLAAKEKARAAKEEERAREERERARREQERVLAEVQAMLVREEEDRAALEGMQESSNVLSSTVLQEAVQLLAHEAPGGDNCVSAQAGGDCDEEGLECVVCLNGTKTMCVVPCLHKALCSSCADVATFINPQTRPFSSCPICRQEMVMPFFMDATLLSHIHKQKIFET